MNSFHISLLAADRPFYDGECVCVNVPTLDGLYGIFANHSNMISAVVPGLISFRLADGTEKSAVVSGGLVKIENNDVLILVDSAERPEDIDAVRARRAVDEAREELLQKRSIREYRTAELRLARAVNRMKFKAK